MYIVNLLLYFLLYACYYVYACLIFYVFFELALLPAYDIASHSG